ncbi:MAG: ABC transporter substrate-binding protein [Patescibacteria group bacterium]
MMTRWEKRATVLLLLLALTLGTIRAYGSYIDRTTLAPTVGGTYREADVGELKYLNPVLAQSDIDKSYSGLIFSSLVRVDTQGVHPDVAERWDISSDGLRYTFYLNKNVYFHDGEKLTAKDVAHTLDAVKATAESAVRSPLYDAWEDVTVTVDDDYQITFVLPRAYGPFIYNADFGIVPAHLTMDQVSSRFVGSGPFRFERTIMSSKKKIAKLLLSRNKSYYADKPYIDNIEATFFDKEEDAKKALADGDVEAVFGFQASGQNIRDYSYESSRRLGLVFNLRNDKFKDKETRRKILQGETMPEPFSLRVVALNSPLQQIKAEELKTRLSKQNIKIEVIYLNSVQLKDVIDSREFEILLYGFTTGYDRDPYVFWHTSQVDKLNFAGYSDKESDIMLEDARMMGDAVGRNAKYDQFYSRLSGEFVAEFYEPVRYNFSVSESIRGIKPIVGSDAGSRFDHFFQWYMKEGRVKK